jgi:hypothetical protein
MVSALIPVLSERKNTGTAVVMAPPPPRPSAMPQGKPVDALV